MEKTLVTLADLGAEAVRFVNTLVPDPEKATLVTLSGELGAGKTAFTKAVANALGVSDMVASPTFVLEKVYRLPEGQAFKQLVHIDAYRLESGKELSALGFDEIMRDPHTLILLEWPEKVADMLPLPAVRLSLSVAEDGSRHMVYG